MRQGEKELEKQAPRRNSLIFSRNRTPRYKKNLFIDLGEKRIWALRSQGRRRF